MLTVCARGALKPDFVAGEHADRKSTEKKIRVRLYTTHSRGVRYYQLLDTITKQNEFQTEKCSLSC